MGGGVARKRCKKNGFTLAELLAVIAILGILALIVFPMVNKTIKNSKQKAYNQQVESILRSAEHWGLENMSELSEMNENYITIDELKQSGYIESKTVINPMTDEEMNGCIIARYESNQYIYSYNETNCSELNTLPVITLNGDSVITIGVGETYTELGATASYQDTDVTSSIEITDNIDINKVGTYQVRYNVTYDGVSAREVVRTVKVVDNGPVITLKGSSSVTIGLNQTYTYEGATAKTYDGTDISDSIVVTSDVDTTKVGTYTVRYNVTYDGKSAQEITRTVTVINKNPTIVLSSTSTTGYEQSVSINVTVTPYTGNIVSSIKYKLDGGSEQTVSNNVITIDTTGSHTIEVIATDNEGNVGTVTGGTYNIDADKPTIALEVSESSINENGWSKTDVTLNVTTSDTGGSSVSSYKYCTGNNCTPSIPGTGDTITISDEIENIYVCAISIDEALNESEKECVGPYSIDKTISEPSLVATTSANSNGWYKEDIEINLTTSTDTSGISEIKYCKTTTSTTCTPDTSIIGASGTVIIDTESETNYICALSIDNALNESASTCSGPYALDKTGPELTVPADTIIMTEDVASYNLLTGASATDSLSDIDGSITTSGSLSAVEGTYTITYSVNDKAGNNSSDTREITVLETTNWTYTSNGTFTVPATGTYTIEMHGGGGGGGEGSVYGGDSATGGAGGGSGEIYTVTLTKDQTYSIVIGAGGSSGGGRGGTTKFGDLLSLNGGYGGEDGYVSVSGFGSEDGSNGSAVGSLASGSSGGSTVGSYGNGGSGGYYSGGMKSPSGGAAGAVFITWKGATS